MRALTHRYYATIFAGWQFPDAVQSQLEFRKRLFVDELGWDLQHRQGFERDEFDTDAAVYCCLHLDDEMVGCWRAIPTNIEYLGKKIFPQLATLRPSPERSDVWEISRLGVIRHEQRPLSAQYIYALMFHFARSRNARSLCGVVSLIHNRNFVMSGVKTRRYGAPQVIGRDLRGRPITVFFGEILMAEQSSESFKRLLESVNEVELRDEALILGRTTVSA